VLEAAADDRELVEGGWSDQKRSQQAFGREDREMRPSEAAREAVASEWG
jgi:hypothetical protein